MILDQSYIGLKYQVIKAERRVLKELGFCVHIKHPHKVILMLKNKKKETNRNCKRTSDYYYYYCFFFS